MRNVRLGWIGENWLRTRLEELYPNGIVLDLAPAERCDLLLIRDRRESTWPVFFEVKSSRRRARARGAALTEEEARFRELLLGRGYAHEVVRLHRTGTVCEPLEPVSPYLTI